MELIASARVSLVTLYSPFPYTVGDGIWAWHEPVRVDDGLFYRAYSISPRILDGVPGMYEWLDREPEGPRLSAAFAVSPCSVASAVRQFTFSNRDCRR